MKLVLLAFLAFFQLLSVLEVSAQPAEVSFYPQTLGLPGYQISKDFLVSVNGSSVSLYATAGDEEDPSLAAFKSSKPYTSQSFEEHYPSKFQISYGGFDCAQSGILTYQVSITKPGFVISSYKIYPSDAVITHSITNNIISIEQSCRKPISIILNGQFAMGPTLHLFPTPIETDVPDIQNSLVRVINPGDELFLTDEPNVVYFFTSGYHDYSPNATPLNFSGHSDKNQIVSGYDFTSNLGVDKYGMKRIVLKNNQSIYLAPGAFLNAFVYASEAENVKLYGRGVLSQDFLLQDPTRGGWHQVAVQFKKCKNIVIDGIFENKQSNVNWSGAISFSENALVTNYKVISPRQWSTDGLDIESSSHIKYKNCFFRCGDDAIAIKGQSASKPVKDILVEDVWVYRHNNNGLVVGEETKASYISNITFRNCNVIYMSNIAETSTAGFCINQCNSSIIDSILIDNCQTEEVDHAFKVFYAHDLYGGPFGNLRGEGSINNVVVRNFKANKAGSTFSVSGHGIDYDPSKPETVHYSDTEKGAEVRLENCTVAGNPITTLSSELKIGALADLSVNEQLESDFVPKEVYYTIKSAQDNLVLGIAGTEVIKSQPNGTDNQLWQIILDKGWFAFKNKATSQVIVANGATGRLSVGIAADSSTLNRFYRMQNFSNNTVSGYRLSPAFKYKKGAQRCFLHSAASESKLSFFGMLSGDISETDKVNQTFTFIESDIPTPLVIKKENLILNYHFAEDNSLKEWDATGTYLHLVFFEPSNWEGLSTCALDIWGDYPFNRDLIDNKAVDIKLSQTITIPKSGFYTFKTSYTTFSGQNKYGVFNSDFLTIGVKKNNQIIWSLPVGVDMNQKYTQCEISGLTFNQDDKCEVFYQFRPECLGGIRVDWAELFLTGLFTTTSIAGIESEIPGLSIYPNPTTNFINLQFACKSENLYRLSLYNLLGIPVVEKNILVAAGSSTVRVNFEPNLHPGLYVLKVASGVKNNSFRLIIR